MTGTGVTVTESITVSDAKLVEFLDYLRTYHYPQEGDPPAKITRVQAATRFAQGMIQGTKDTYKRYKQLSDREALPAPGEIDA